MTKLLNFQNNELGTTTSPKSITFATGSVKSAQTRGELSNLSSEDVLKPQVLQTATNTSINNPLSLL